LGTCGSTLLAMMSSARLLSTTNLSASVAPKVAISVGNLGARSDHGGGADGEYRYSKWLEVLQQEAVVAGELHHKALGSKAQTLLNHMAVTASVLYPACGVGMGCVFVQDPTYTFDVPELHQKAPVANDRVQRTE
jgi:hypothetical protein